MKLTARAPQFVFAQTIASHWCPGDAEFSHAASAFMSALPHLEPYFIHNVREALPRVHDPKLREEIEGFVLQEARHAQAHRRFNQLLATRYPQLPSFERALRERLERSKQEHSLAFRLAYTAGYEAITYHLVGLMMDERQRWFQGADASVLAMLTWHAAEEVEHKNVAYDLFNAVHGGYLLRARGLFTAFYETIRDLRRITRYMLEVDGLYEQRACRRRLTRMRMLLMRGLVPRFLAYLKPRYSPREERDPPLLQAWLARDARGEVQTALSLSDLEQLDREARDARQTRTSANRAPAPGGDQPR